MIKEISTNLSRSGGRVLTEHWPFLIVLFLLTMMNLRGIARIPFHPDESTYLFMSMDFEELFRNPFTLVPEELSLSDPKVRYRLIDAPLARYLIGASLQVSGLPGVAQDWDWGGSFESNIRSGAFPEENSLLASRFATALLLPISMVGMYAIGRRMAGKWAGLLAAILLGTNSLVLLHTRRAMAEGPLLLGTILFLWAITQPKIRPILIGGTLAFAVNAKHSAVALVPLAAVALYPGPWSWTVLRSIRDYWPDTGKNYLKFGLTLLALTWALNPVSWKNPLQAIELSAQERSALLARQLSDTQRLAPNQVVDKPGERVVSLLANTFVLPPSFHEVGNYLEWTSESEASYLSNPLNTLFRGILGGALLLILFFFGFFSGWLEATRKSMPARRTYLLLIMATLLQIGSILAIIPLPWQRYTIPVVPLVCLWISSGLVLMGQTVIRSTPRHRETAMDLTRGT